MEHIAHPQGIASFDAPAKLAGAAA